MMPGSHSRHAHDAKAAKRIDLNRECADFLVRTPQAPVPRSFRSITASRRPKCVPFKPRPIACTLLSSVVSTSNRRRRMRCPSRDCRWAHAQSPQGMRPRARANRVDDARTLRHTIPIAKEPERDATRSRRHPQLRWPQHAVAHCGPFEKFQQGDVAVALSSRR
eukprot:Amastigsp_a511359_54.p3 type:complete len:164 gc:universal Amastigsp_a511359_54:1041-1532(+)